MFVINIEDTKNEVVVEETFQKGVGGWGGGGRGGGVAAMIPPLLWQEIMILDDKS